MGEAAHLLCCIQRIGQIEGCDRGGSSAPPAHGNAHRFQMTEVAAGQQQVGAGIGKHHRKGHTGRGPRR
tara:strand:- start:25910 stop:26116 length:207 start_codon:yes stop_codon:yes gene_type:complete